MYLMFRLKLDFNGSHGDYFRKKIVVDIFNDDIKLLALIKKEKKSCF